MTQNNPRLWNDATTNYLAAQEDTYLCFQERSRIVIRFTKDSQIEIKHGLAAFGRPMNLKGKDTCIQWRKSQEYLRRRGYSLAQ